MNLSTTKRAVLWLSFLAPFFYLSYGTANWLASLQPNVPSIVFGWERAVPFLPWTIVPYWSINAFYALSLFVNEDTRGVDRLAGRYLTAQLVSVACFIAFPLTATFVRPDTEGLPGFMFAVLGGFDKPFNQAPSLHIALLVIIWDHLRRRLHGVWLQIWHAWCVLIGLSVLTTWQHHFIDIPTGALLGLFALWLFPQTGPMPFSGFRLTADAKRRKLAGYYGAGALLCLAGAVTGAYSSPLWLALLWPAIALAIVSFAYLGGGPKVFQKTPEGQITLASRLLLWPYRAGARINAWAWTRRLTGADHVLDNVWLGRFPRGGEADRFGTVIDLTAEFEAEGKGWKSVPMLDLVPPDIETLGSVAAAIDKASQDGPVLVCCALGFQRSAAAVACWLVATGRAQNAEAAEMLLRKTGRPIHLPKTASHEALA